MAEKLFFRRSYYFLVAGLFFLINPLFNVLDMLPDVFGYLLIYIGISELALLEGRIESSRTKIRYLIAISTIKLLITPAVFTSAHSSDKLLAAFCFAIVELILLILFYRDFFEGFSYLALRNDGEKTLRALPNARFLTLLFFITKVALSVLPELYSLAETRLQFEVSYYEFYQSLISTKPYTQLFSLFVVLIIGIFWYISVFRMLRAAKKELPFLRKLQQQYAEEYLNHPEKQRLRVMRLGFYTALASFVFFSDIAVDGIRIFPLAASVLLVAVSALIMKKQCVFRRTLKLAPYVLLIQLITEVFRYIFIDTNAVLLDEIKLSSAGLSAVVILISSCAVLLFMSVYLGELRSAYSEMVNSSAPTFSLCKLLFLIFISLYSLQVVLPNIKTSVSGTHLLLVVVFIILCVRNFSKMIYEYEEKIKYL